MIRKVYQYWWVLYSFYGHNIGNNPPDDNESPNEPISDSDLEKNKER